ncbi:MAG: hypothetical protein Q4D19_03615 [Lautropia sp.]|nr:hypothetical protein [Lautropia sp.]
MKKKGRGVLSDEQAGERGRVCFRERNAWGLAFETPEKHAPKEGFTDRKGACEDDDCASGFLQERTWRFPGELKVTLGVLVRGFVYDGARFSSALLFFWFHFSDAPEHS